MNKQTTCTHSRSLHPLVSAAAVAVAAAGCLHRTHKQHKHDGKKFNCTGVAAIPICTLSHSNFLYLAVYFVCCQNLNTRNSENCTLCVINRHVGGRPYCALRCEWIQREKTVRESGKFWFIFCVRKSFDPKLKHTHIHKTCSSEQMHWMQFYL